MHQRVSRWRWQREPGNTEAYARIEDNRFLPAIGESGVDLLGRCGRRVL